MVDDARMFWIEFIQDELEPEVEQSEQSSVWNADAAFPEYEIYRSPADQEYDLISFADENQFTSTCATETDKRVLGFIDHVD